jgi:hypothetical protein
MNIHTANEGKYRWQTNTYTHIHRQTDRQTNALNALHERMDGGALRIDLTVRISEADPTQLHQRRPEGRAGNPETH